MHKKLHVTFNAPVTLVFVIICFIATIMGIVSKGSLTQLLFMTYHSPIEDPMTWLRFFTHVFGHTGLDHFIGNAAYLLLLGPMLEEKYGKKCLSGVILITAFITGIFNYFVFPDIGLCGASGVVFAFILLASFTGFRKGEIPLTFLLVLAVFLGQQIYEGVTIQDNISNSSHILGGIIGSILGYQLNCFNSHGKPPMEPPPSDPQHNIRLFVK